MSYYDSIKDSVKDDGDSGGKEAEANFDTLREAAEETSEQEQQGDDTEIEVLEEGLRKSSGSSSRNSQGGQKQSQPSRQQQPSPEGRAGDTPGSGQGLDSSAVEEKLDRIIEQNARMIEILESFGN